MTLFPVEEIRSRLADVVQMAAVKARGSPRLRGVPDNAVSLPDGEVLQWRQDQQVQGTCTIKGTFFLELDLSGHGTCHLVARMRQGRVAQVEYTGPSGPMLGPYSACRPLVLACEKQARLALKSE